MDTRPTRRVSWTHAGDEDHVPDASGLPRNPRALTVDDMDVAFQPIVVTETGETFATEALARCRWPEYGNPEKLFQAAVIFRSTGWVGRVVREATFARHPELPVFINLHPAELSSRWLVRPDDPITSHDGPVYLEITEAASFQHFDLCVGVLKEVCARTRAKLVVDDLGAGHSDLERVFQLEPAMVKLDRSLVRGLDKSRRMQVTVRRLVELFAGLDAAVVGEGVETPEELAALRDLGVGFAQGFLLGHPTGKPGELAVAQATK